MVTNNSVNQSAVAREAVAVLSASHSSLEAQERVTQLLRNLAADPDNRASIATAGAIPQLARQLRDGLPYGQEMAANALAQVPSWANTHSLVPVATLVSKALVRRAVGRSLRSSRRRFVCR